MRLKNYLNVFLVLLLILFAMIAPSIFGGYFDLQAAQTFSAQSKFSEAAQKYESAAGKLFWRSDLWEQAGLAATLGQDPNKDSIRLLEIARQKNSLTDIGWYTLGDAYWVYDDHKTALEVWQAGEKQFPNYVFMYDKLAAAYDEIGDYSSEQIALVKRLSLADDAWTHYRLALLLTLSDSDGALRHLSAASALDPQYDSVVQTLRTTLNIAALDNNPSTKMITIGRGLGLVNEWALATQAFESAVSADGKNAEALAWLGEAKQQTGQDGSDELNKALALNPTDPIVRGLRGLFWKRQGKFAEALNEYVQASQIEPENPAWQAAIGEEYFLNGDLVAALTAYQRATQLAPNDANYWRMLAMFCADNGVQVLDIGLPAAKKAAELSPNDAQVLDALGWTYLNVADLANAKENLLNAEKAAPDSALIHIHVAEMYLHLADKSSALVELNLAKQLDPNGAVGNFATQLLKQFFP